jgi:hypothetical protein
MFNPKTERIKELAAVYPSRIDELNGLFDKRTNIYIDFANAIHWQGKLRWHISLKRMKQFFDSFSTVNEVKFYNGELEGDLDSFEILKEAGQRGYIVRSKPVKIICLVPPRCNTNVAN